MSNVKIGMKCNINLLVLVLFISNFYWTKVFQILYSTHTKLNGSMEASIMRLKNKLNLLSYVYVEKLPY
jgi:hypothetical protein